MRRGVGSFFWAIGFPGPFTTASKVANLRRTRLEAFFRDLRFRILARLFRAGTLGRFGSSRGLEPEKRREGRTRKKRKKGRDKKKEKEKERQRERKGEISKERKEKRKKK